MTPSSPDRSGASGAGSDFLVLDIGAAPARGLSSWLAGEIRTAIQHGRLRPGAALPATRTLADDLGISRGVVVEAYRRIAEEGLVTGRAGGGTTVAALPTTVHQVAAAEPGLDFDHPPALPLAGRVRDAPYDLTPGLPDLTHFPRGGWLRAERAVLSATAARDLGYGDSRGHPRLRAELAGWLGRVRGVRATPDDIVVVSGVAQALALLAGLLVADGVRTIAGEDPGSRGARQQLAHWGVTTDPVPVDEHGLDVPALRRCGRSVVLVTPAHQFPMGVVLSAQRRRELAGWAADGGLVIEDDYDAEHRYDRSPVPALQASCPDRVIYTGSVSKILAPAMRLGWIVAPPAWRDRLAHAKHASDLGSPTLPQLVLAELIASGRYEHHVRSSRARQRLRRDAMVAELVRLLPGARVLGVAAGLHLVVEFPPADVGSDTRLAARLRERGVLAHPLSWYRSKGGPPGLVLGYAAMPPDRLRTAAQLIADTATGSG